MHHVFLFAFDFCRAMSKLMVLLFLTGLLAALTRGQVSILSESIE
jgi:hypothetical protein